MRPEEGRGAAEAVKGEGEGKVGDSASASRSRRSGTEHGVGASGAGGTSMSSGGGDKAGAVVDATSCVTLFGKAGLDMVKILAGLGRSHAARYARNGVEDGEEVWVQGEIGVCPATNG